MTKYYCPYCGTECRKEKNIWICPNHGRVTQEVHEDSNPDRSYLEWKDILNVKNVGVVVIR